MKLTKKVEIGNNIYYIVVDVVYKKAKNNLRVYALKIINMVIGMEGLVLF